MSKLRLPVMHLSLGRLARLNSPTRIASSTEIHVLDRVIPLGLTRVLPDPAGQAGCSKIKQTIAGVRLA
jgi:hypothetical protein